ncbi:THUMP domain-containing protein [Colletotrichum paranaense]|uniref:THUMP domain-containing protein n=3 Tax=Colletotrichum acutatum species complex TaxID=2707335 RepID=A0AAI9XKQ7_9PEZI|nr:THUMP domain-containing protein [Colletotrichum paranaense]KAK0373524.1 THUMP domain-containing protein [Colletotrichum limetticola]KAK1451555.1 THUMP domain-containing protein [Colletotrichum melonis]KAK1541591.1 THUMP domain-containing protein [Colletotrichum paranaense]
MTDGKRKQSGGVGGHSAKRSKGGQGSGKWQTPQHKAKVASLQDKGVALGVGDKGIWVTFARGMDGKSISEFSILCDEYAKILYDIVPPGEEVESDEEDEDIEASIKKELDGISEVNKGKTKRTFKAIKAGIECVFFMKTRDPIDPVELCRKMCIDASVCTDLKERKTKYINRLTPVTSMDKASENGVVRVARKALAAHFDLVDETAQAAEGDAEKVEGGSDARTEKPACTYAIRPSIRSNNSLDRDTLIKQIASVVSPRHKVDLTNADKVILVDVFQSFCGMSVIERSDWEDLKKLNVNELYKASPGAQANRPAPKEGENEAA